MTVLSDEQQDLDVLLRDDTEFRNFVLINSKTLSTLKGAHGEFKLLKWSEQRGIPSKKSDANAKYDVEILEPVNHIKAQVKTMPVKLLKRGRNKGRLQCSNLSMRDKTKRTNRLGIKESTTLYTIDDFDMLVVVDKDDLYLCETRHLTRKDSVGESAFLINASQIIDLSIWKHFKISDISDENTELVQKYMRDCAVWLSHNPNWVSKVQPACSLSLF